MTEFSIEPSIRDYVSPGYATISLDAHFPNLMRVSDPNILNCKALLKHRKLHHYQYWDRRAQGCGFVNRDEAHILYNTALRYRDKPALEIGCFLGWSACHLLAGGVTLDIIDPLLKETQVHESVLASIRSCGADGRARLISESSPDAVALLGMSQKRKWQLFFIDGNHQSPGPLLDTFISTRYAEPDCLMLFHDLWLPGVVEALDYLQSQGWNTVVYDTFHMMGAAWRGDMEPIAHTPDPNTGWPMPTTLQHHPMAKLVQ